MSAMRLASSDWYQASGWRRCLETVEEAAIALIAGKRTSKSTMRDLGNDIGCIGWNSFGRAGGLDGKHHALRLHFLSRPSPAVFPRVAPCFFRREITAW